MLVLSTASSIGAVRFLWLATSHLAEVGNVLALTIAVTWRIAIAATALAAMLGIFYRRQWARWFGILAIAALAFSSILGPDSTNYANNAERAGGSLARLVIIPLILAWWGHAFGFSTKAKRYFESRSTMA
jgi:hypothetical protein